MDCLRIDGIKESMKKLNSKTENGKSVIGEVVYQDNRGGENRYTYKYNGNVIFTFGFSRGSRLKEIKLSYVPRQMHLTNPQYKEFHACAMSKSEFNDLLIKNGFIK